MSDTTTKIRWGIKGKKQLPLFMVWEEFLYRGNVIHANVLFNTMDWRYYVFHFFLGYKEV